MTRKEYNKKQQKFYATKPVFKHNKDEKRQIKTKVIQEDWQEPMENVIRYQQDRQQG